MITKDSSGLLARNAVSTPLPPHPLSEGEDQGTSSQLALPSTSPCSALVSLGRLAGTSP